jgi:hypothetical protein
MSDPENFVTRWSRLKRESEREKEAGPSEPPLGPETIAADKDGATAVPPAEGMHSSPVFDPASLPPIESITAGTDIRSFLRAGVPAELTRAALRRVWTTDPAIRDFISIAENQWDFADPTAMPGFGPLEATDDVRQLVDQAMGKLSDTSDAIAEVSPPTEQAQASATLLLCTDPSTDQEQQAFGIPERNETDAQITNAASEEHTEVCAAVQHHEARAKSGAVDKRRVHGGALPK